MVVIIDYKVGNIISIQKMLRRVGCLDSIITSCSDEIALATKIILPGVGNFDYGINKLKESGLIDILNKRVIEDKIPILGICLGAQLLTNGSEEGTEKGLGWIDAKTVKFNKSKLPLGLKIPNMGWLDVKFQIEAPIFKDLPPKSRFYFVHSYHIECNIENDIAVTAEYGYEFTAGIIKDNIMGVQFHPEKSHKYGMQILNNFINNYN